MTSIPVWAKLAAIAASAAAIGLGGVKAGSWYVHTQWDREKLLQAQANDKEEDRRYAAQKDLLDQYSAEMVRAETDRAAADDAAAGLRQRIAKLAKGAAATTAGPATQDAIGVLANVLSKSDERAGILAEHADRSRAAGIACERAYDSLTPPD